ncbi:MAG TPA: CHAT domain-containing tetratricopeptide repeat protein, partial [bacterium]|nr:CHAT domain-containing tetratricopeptide repeat protein [bacterium]
LGNLANAYNITGRIPEAKTTTERAIELARRSGNETGIFSAHHRLTGILHRMGELDLALAQSDSAIARSEDIPTLRLSALVRRSTLLWDLGRRDEAIATLDDAVRMARETGAGRAERFAQANRAVMLVAAQQPREALDAIEALGPAWREETEVAGIQVDTVRGQALLQLGREEEALRTLEAARDELERLREAQADRATAESLQQNAGEVYAVLAGIALDDGRPADAWAETERGRSAVLRSLLTGGSGEPAPLADVQSALRDANAALIQFTESSSRPLHVFVITADRVAAVAGPDVLETRELVRTALARLSSGLSDAECRPALRRLGEALLDNALALVPDSVERLYVVSPTVLDSFPFGAVPWPEPDDPALSERFAIAYLPGASALPILAQRPVAAGGMAVFADPARPVAAARPSDGSAERSAPNLAALPQARREARAIAIRGARLLLGESATREALRGAPLTAVLHFATHALVDVFRADRSGLVLAGEDGLLSAPEVESLRLSPDLVTLSGCRTNGGFRLTGEGTVGLTRAFLVAGGRTVVTSLWDVRDDAARRFMEVFYAELRAGLPRDEALHRTRATLAREGYPPRDCAAFVVTGVGHEPVAALAGASGAGRVGTLLLPAVALVAPFLLLSRRSSSRTV